MDEPNSALSAAETERLFTLLRRLRDKGLTIIYVSHRLEEVFAIADRISVIRDGRYQGTWPIAETSIPEVIAQMIGRRLGETFPHREAVPAEAPVAVAVRGLRIGAQVGPVDFEVRAGEILGFAGLEGSGVNDVFQVLFGLDKPAAGEVVYKGRSRAAAIAVRGDPAGVRADPGQSPGRRVDDLLVDPAQRRAWPCSTSSSTGWGMIDRDARAGTRERLRAEAQRRHR